ncbi:hypothetical protein FJZ55_09085 [Candidatus Woesearchaeota archaeon]|nr:hypothetical protein [Candidatus Woesearchaeota archaeon]
MKKFLVENKLGAYSKLKEEKFYAPSYVAQKYGSKAKEIEANIEDEEDNNPNIWDLYTSLETAEETDEFVKGFMNEGESGLTPLQQYIYNYEVEISGEDFANEELEDIKKLNTLDDVENYYGDIRGWDNDKDFKYDLKRLLKTLRAKKLAEGEAAYEDEDDDVKLTPQVKAFIDNAAKEKKLNYYQLIDLLRDKFGNGGFMVSNKVKDYMEKNGIRWNADTKSTSVKSEGDGLPLTPKLQKFIDKVISDAKKDGEFEELVQVDYFENDLIDFILEKFDEEGNYDNVTQEVKDYINKSVKDYYRNPDGTPFFSEDLGQDRTDAEAEKMMDFLAEKDKTEEALSQVTLPKNISATLGSNNPEGDKLVLRFLQGIAKKFDYPVAKAAMFVKERLKQLGY